MPPSITQAARNSNTMSASCAAGSFVGAHTRRPMARPTAWDDADLLQALGPYEAWLSGRGLSPFTVPSEVGYARRFLDWRTGSYMPRGMPLPTRRPVPAGKRDLGGLIRELGLYGACLRSGGREPGAIVTYMGSAKRFVNWLGGVPAPAKRRNSQARPAERRTAVDHVRRPDGLAAEYARIAATHRDAILRTVARMAIPGSVGRVFNPGTTAALTKVLPDLNVEQLPEVVDQADYRRWFEASLERVAGTIRRLNPRDSRPGIYPGYKWGHATKILCLLVRDLTLHSRYFTEDEVDRIQRWLYCPVDGIVIRRLRGAGFEPGVNLIREIDEAGFWRIQDGLSEAAAAGVPRVWFDDVWSETRD